MADYYDSRGTRWANLRKFNPNHDDQGRFSEGDGGGGEGGDRRSGSGKGGAHPLTTSAQREAYANFARADHLTAENKVVEESAIRHYISDKEGLNAAYVSNNGDKLISADLARPLFKEDGYNGTNAAAVQEPATALAKDRWRDALTSHPAEKDAVLYAGGSGSGKTSAIDKLMPELEGKAAAVLDGNLSKLSSAQQRINEALAAGKEPHIVYAYREPAEAWEKGVIARMRFNESEAGRLVPMSVFIANSKGSLEVARQLQEAGYRVTPIDNSRGKGQADFMSPSRFASLTYPSDTALRATLTARTTALLHSGAITKEQYDALLQ